MNNNTSKIFTIISHEYITKVTSKAFIIMSLIGPLLMVAMIGIPVLVTMLTGNSTEKKIAILDRSGLNIGQKMAQAEPDKYFLTEKSPDNLQKQVQDDELDGYLDLPSNIVTTSKAIVYTRGGGGIGFISSIERSVGQYLRTERLMKAGVDTSVISLVEQGVDIQTKKITNKGTEKDYTAIYAGLGYFLGLFIYFMMFMYGSMVMRSVIEEKANRIIEVIASSAKPIEIMFGKVIGMGAVGLTQVLFWAIIGGILMAFAGPIMGIFTPKTALMAQQVAAQGNNMPVLPGGFEIPSISVWLVLAFIFYFLSGYFIYASLYAAVGSAVDQEQDAQQLVLPITIPIIIPILFIGSVISNPDGTLSVVLSMIPFFTPILMIVRIAASEVPVWQLVVSTVLMLSTLFGTVWFASKIYRVGILMYGKKPNFKDLIKWIKVS